MIEKERALRQIKKGQRERVSITKRSSIRVVATKLKYVELACASE